jgi:hypothetical protein
MLALKRAAYTQDVANGSHAEEEQVGELCRLYRIFGFRHHL